MILFDTNKDLDLSANTIIDKKLKELFREDDNGKFSVILHNDHINGVEYVTKIIKEVFGYGTGKSIWLMLKAHFTGSCVVWIGPLKEAEKKKNIMISYGPDPNMVHRGALPLRVTVEKNI